MFEVFAVFVGVLVLLAIGLVVVGGLAAFLIGLWSGLRD
ncbi:MAG: hypothetical protein QG597_3983 [Actinomycetota bacterium]|nr:hypothetical protein [Actinomycetota bacterium]